MASVEDTTLGSVQKHNVGSWVSVSHLDVNWQEAREGAYKVEYLSSSHQRPCEKLGVVAHACEGSMGRQTGESLEHMAGQPKSSGELQGEP